MSNINPNPFTTRPEIEGTFGVVTTTHWIATAVGMGTLEKGGNAFAAVVATAFTLQVMELLPNAPGGGDLRPGTCARARHHRPLQERGPRHGPRHRAAGCLRSRPLRVLDVAA